MKVLEVKKFAIDYEDEVGDIAPYSDAAHAEAIERNLDAEVIYKISNLTTDEIDVYMSFIDRETNEEAFLGIIDGATAFTLLEHFGIDFPETL